MRAEKGRAMDRRGFNFLALLAFFLLGCAPADSRAPSTAALPDHVQRYAELPGLSSSPHAGLKAELALLVQEQMTPLALDAQQDALRSQTGSPKVDGRKQLAESIPAISRPLLKAQLDEVYRSGPLRLSPLQMERAREISRRWADDRARFEQALDSCGGGLGLRMADGNLADVRFLDVMGLGCRLEALAAAEALAENQPEAAIAPLAVMLRSARVLAREWNVTSRVTAANLRSDALHVLGAVANHEHATRHTHERLAELLARETADWPPDAAAWVGDRAAGLIAYELVRDGYYFSLLEQSELQKLREGGLVDASAKAVMRNLDGDELFYLAAMRRMIESGRLPYYERLPELRAIRRELAAREASADYPLVAGRLLLNDFETGHRRQAEDLALMLGWKVALQHATSRAAPELAINPLTGEPLEMEASASFVRIGGLQQPAEGAVEIALRPVQQARRPGPR